MFLKRLNQATYADLFALAFAKSICKGAIVLIVIALAVIAVEAWKLSSLTQREEILRRLLADKAAVGPASRTATGFISGN